MPTKYDERLSYKIVENGYEIYIDGKLIITQYETEKEDLAHVYKKDGTYEENCMIQLKELADGMAIMNENEAMNDEMETE